jgi:RNA polymerase sigma-70 factor (ECF subfamily)
MGIGLIMEETDRSLLGRYRRGDVYALEKLVEKYKRPLFGYIVNMTGGNVEADEIFQEVWLRVIKKINSYKHKNFGGWLMRIAHNIVIDRARRKKGNISLDQEYGSSQSMLDFIADDRLPLLSSMDASALGVKIMEAVAGLPVEQKEVFLMRTKSDLAFKEIAKIQKVSINTALARMQYALAKLRTILADEYKTINE